MTEEIDKSLEEAVNNINKQKTVDSNTSTDITVTNAKETSAQSDKNITITKRSDTNYRKNNPSKGSVRKQLGFAAESDQGKIYDNFRAFVNGAGLAITMGNGKQYLLAEAWLYLAHLHHLTPSCTTTEVLDGSHLVSVKARCELVDDLGNVVAVGEMIASKSEAFLKDLDDYAVYGMAQTRAITRTLRNVYGYIARGAGFESTPAIEVGLEKVKE